MNPTQITINPNIPGTLSSNSFPGLVANFYSFALVIAGILAFGAIVYGGIIYATGRGNPSRESEGKSWITNALLGLLLLGAAYVILYTINPQLVNLQVAGLPQLPAGAFIPGVGVPGAPTGPVTPTAACAVPTAGPCTVSKLQSTCLSGNAQLFAGICGHESGGNPALVSGTDDCLDSNGNLKGVSVGLFQINLTNSWNTQVDGQNCSAAFQGQAISCTNNTGQWLCTTGSNGTGQPCKIVNAQLYQDCVAAAQNGVANIAAACQLSSNGSALGPWKADANACGF